MVHGGGGGGGVCVVVGVGGVVYLCAFLGIYSIGPALIHSGVNLFVRRAYTGNLSSKLCTIL